MSESRYTLLYKTEPRITGSATQLIADYIPGAIGRESAAEHLALILKALETLQGLPTARLERAFAEHVDCASYRLDAWQQGLIQYQLAAMRHPPAAIGPVPYRRRPVVTQRGIYLGAFGWLEDVRPSLKSYSTPSLDPELAQEFQPPGSAPLLSDPGNGGYIHAPSHNQAVTAAVLRSGYLPNAETSTPQALAVNLSSARVRVALGVLEGVRQGQSLGALLGYQLERGLHDRYNLAEVDKFILPLRKQFPLAGDRLKETRTDQTVPIEAVEARNVVDGLALVNHINVDETRLKQYPFGLPDRLPPLDSPGEAVAINAEVERLLETHDAIADLAIAEGVYQAVQSNYDRAAAHLDTYGKGQRPPEPAVVRTPRTGRVLTHRVGLHFEAVTDAGVSPVAGVPVTPRARAEPAVNRWLSSVLPEPGRVACRVLYCDPVANEWQPPANKPVVTQQDLQLQPLDLLHLAAMEGRQAMSEIDDRILLHVTRTAGDFRPDAAVSIQYLPPLGDDKVSFFELAPLVRSLRGLLLRSRPLRASDLELPAEATPADGLQTAVARDRMQKAYDGLKALADALSAYQSSLQLLHDRLPGDPSAVLGAFDANLARFLDLSQQAGLFGVPNSGWGFALDWRRNRFQAMFASLTGLAGRMDARLADFDARIAAYDALSADTPDDERRRVLAGAELALCTTLTVPAPDSPADYRAALVARRGMFVARLGQVRATLSDPQTSDHQWSLAGVRNAVSGIAQGPPPLSDFDPQGIDLAKIDADIIAFSADLMGRAGRLSADIQGRRLNPAREKLRACDATAQEGARAELLDQAARLLLGDEFQIVPDFRLADDRQGELRNARAASLGGKPFEYQTTQLGHPQPVDTWLYGLARVREKMQQWEQVVLLSGGFRRPEPELLPVQLPYREGEDWLGLEYRKLDSDHRLDSDRLLYTAHFPAGFDESQPQRGLLLDEFTEVIPSETESTAIAFQYDRPNAEPPQTLLLVTPADPTGSWDWSDLVDAVSETLDRAKVRGVEPAHIDTTPYAHLIPAAIFPAMLYQISIRANLAECNNVLQHLGANANG